MNYLYCQSLPEREELYINLTFGDLKNKVGKPTSTPPFPQFWGAWTLCAPPQYRKAVKYHYCGVRTPPGGFLFHRKRSFLWNKKRILPGRILHLLYKSAARFSTSSIFVAQLVANRTTVCVSSFFSQKLNMTFSRSRSIWEFSSTINIWFVGESR